METDPVCGMTVEPARAAATRAHDGHTYYFCCDHCAAKFRENPAKYLTPSPSPPAHQAPAAAQHTTPGAVSDAVDALFLKLAKEAKAERRGRV